MKNKIYWLWLTLKSEIKPKELSALVKKNISAKAIYDIEDKEELYGLSETTVNAILDKSLEKANEVAAKIEKMGWYILTFEDDEYPTMLKKIYFPPYVLYLTGEKLDWDRLLTITVVGTRSFDNYGREATEYIAKDLALEGVTIVSGMARGIDSIAGITAIKNGGKTIAVLGSGLDVVYPPEHGELYDMIRKNGVVMTEYPPGTPPAKENFPRRNRIMAGLSYGVLVTQAPKKSGALITAGFAVESGRDVYAVPASIFLKASEGSNSLITQGAKAVTSAGDIICEYPYFDLNKIQEKNISKGDKLCNINFNELTERQVQIVKRIGNGTVHIDELSRDLKLASYELNSEMIMLEINGIVKKLNGNIYELSY